MTEYTLQMHSEKMLGNIKHTGYARAYAQRTPILQICLIFNRL